MSSVPRFDDRAWALLDALRAKGVAVSEAAVAAIEALPQERTLTSDEISRALIDAMPEIGNEVQSVLAERAPRLGYAADGTNPTLVDQIAAAQSGKGVHTEIEGFSLRAMSALRKMAPEDQAAILAAIPSGLHAAAQLVGEDIGASPKEIARIEDKIRAAIAANDERSTLDDAFLAALKTRDTIITAMREGAWQISVLKGGVPLRELLFESGISPAELKSIAEQLELLQDLHGEKDLSRMSPRLKGALATFGALNVPDLINHAGHELAEALFLLLERTAREERSGTSRPSARPRPVLRSARMVFR